MARFGPYELIERLGHGGMGEVYRAVLRREGAFEKPVVVKRILPTRSSDPEFQRMFNREARIAALLNHPHIVHVYDYGREGDEYFLAMEWVDGADLGSLLEHIGRPPLPVTLAVLIGVARALDYAHRRRDAGGERLQIVHRDVSPGNVLLGREGEVKLTDFGLVTAGPIEEASDAGTVKGKYTYMSPEQTYGDPVDARSDLFAWGVLAYEMLAGRRPFEGDIVDVLTAIREGRFEPLPTALGPESLIEIVHDCLRVHREERPGSAAAVIAVLEAVPVEESASDVRNAVAQWVDRGLDRPRQPIAAFERTEVADAPLSPGSESEPPAVEARRLRRGALVWWLVAALGLTVLAAVSGLLLARTSLPRGAWPPPAVADLAAPSPTRLHIDTRPPGADLTVDGNAVGSAPIGIEIASERGAVEVLAELDGYEPARIEIELASLPVGDQGSRALTLELDPLPAEFHVLSEPDGALVMLDGEPFGETPTRLRVESPGTHTLTLTRPGYQTHEETVLARPGGAREWVINLRPLPVLRIEGRPSGARASVVTPDGPPAECTTPCELALSPGSLAVEVGLDGYVTFEQSLNMTRSDTLRYQLNPVPRQLTASWRSRDLRLSGGGRQRLAERAREETIEFESTSRDLSGSIRARVRAEPEAGRARAEISVRCVPWSSVELAGERVDGTPAVIEVGGLEPGVWPLVLRPGGDSTPVTIELVIREE